MSQLGIVTYNIAKDWDLPTILSRLEKLDYEGVELRTTHAHKVEVNLSKQERDDVRKRFEDSPVQLAGLGSAFEYHAADPAVVRKNIDGTKEYVRLAHDVGAPGVKVRPNGVPKGGDLDATLRQIGAALHEIGDDAADFGVAIRVEVHGSVTSRAAELRQDHGICRSSQCLHVLEFQSVRRQGRLDQGELRAGRSQDSRSASARLDRRGVPVARAVRALASAEVRRLHARRDSGEQRPGAGAAVFPQPVAGVSAEGGVIAGLRSRPSRRRGATSFESRMIRASAALSAGTCSRTPRVAARYMPAVPIRSPSSKVGMPSASSRL